MRKYVNAAAYDWAIALYQYFFAKCRTPEPIPLDPRSAIILDDYLVGLREISALVKQKENHLNKKLWKTK